MRRPSSICQVMTLHACISQSMAGQRQAAAVNVMTCQRSTVPVLELQQVLVRRASDVIMTYQQVAAVQHSLVLSMSPACPSHVALQLTCSR